MKWLFIVHVILFHVLSAQTQINYLVDSRDGRVYLTVQIGSQTWMAQNINVGVMIDSKKEQTDNHKYTVDYFKRPIIEKYCYDNLESNCNTHGGLYQWGEAMQYATKEKGQGICPDGWHIPSRNDFNILFNNLKEPDNEVYKKWFFSLFGGFRNSYGTCDFINSYGFYWSSNMTTALDLKYVGCTFNSYSSRAAEAYFLKETGISVRCIKN